MVRAARAATKPVPAHGTRARYRSTTRPCHCPDCRAGNAAASARYKAHRTGTALHQPATEWTQLSLWRSGTTGD